MGRAKKEKSLKQSVPTLWQIFVRFWPWIRKQRGLIIASCLALFAEVGLRLLEPWPLKYVFDRITEATAGTAYSVPLDHTVLLLLCAGAVVAIAGLRAAASYLRRVGFALAGSRVLTRCRSELFTHLQRLSLSFHHQARTGDLITRVTGDIGRVKEVAITAAMPMMAHVITLAGMVVIMLFMDWRLGLMSLIILPLFLLSTRKYGGRIRKVAREQRQRKGEMGATAAEAIGSIRVVQALSLEDIHADAFKAANKSDLREGVKAKRLSAKLIGTTDVLIAVATAVVLWYGAGLVLRGALSAGDLIVFLAYLKSAFRPMRNMAKYSGRVAKAAASAERIMEVLDTTPLIQNRPDAVEAPDRIEVIRFESVTFGYEPDTVALDALSLEARRGQVTVLAGPSGAGKTTIINLLLRLYDPREGAITIDGRDLREFTMETLRRRVAIVPQENVLFRVSVRDNIAFGAPAATDEQITAAARLARAHKFISRMPQGYDTLVGERGDTLSEGQRQRISIARAAVRQSPILVLDEPTSSLDNENNRLIRESLREMSRDRITFIIAHDLSTVQDDCQVLFVEDGRVLERGTHAELIRQGGRYAAMYELQQQRITQRLGDSHAVVG